MSVYITILCAPFVIHAISLIFFKGNKNLEIFLNIALLIVFVGLRNYTVGADTFRYARHFYQIREVTSYQSILDVAFEHESPFYVLLAWVVSRFTDSFTNYFLIIAGVHYLSFGYLLKRFSLNVTFSFFVYSSLFLALQLSGVKNTLATSFLFLALIFALDKKKWLFLISIVIAYFFHRTTLVFIIVYPLINIKKIKIDVYLYVALLGILFVLKSPISSLAKRIGGYEDYGVYQATPWMMFILCAAIVLFALYVKKYGETEHFESFIKIAMIASFAMVLVFVNPSSLRIVRYFLIVATILLPEAFKIIELNQPNRWHVILLMVPFYLILGYQFIGSISGAEQYVYEFYWQ